MSPLFVFATSKSGHVSPPEGASLGWMAGAIAGMAAIFGIPQPASAYTCDEVQPGSCGSWYCAGQLCQEEPPKIAKKRLCRSPITGECTEETGACECSV
jgi:hypothetical protein